MCVCACVMMCVCVMCVCHVRVSCVCMSYMCVCVCQRGKIFGTLVCCVTAIRRIGVAISPCVTPPWQLYCPCPAVWRLCGYVCTSSHVCIVVVPHCLR